MQARGGMSVFCVLDAFVLIFGSYVVIAIRGPGNCSSQECPKFQCGVCKLSSNHSFGHICGAKTDLANCENKLS
jgi:hypothetical protein